MPRERQLASLRMIKTLVDREDDFESREETRALFTKAIGIYKNWNSSPPGSADYQRHKSDLDQIAFPTVAVRT